MNVSFNYNSWDLWQLYHKVTFDGANRIIYVNDDVTELNIKTDIYSDWKEWVYSRDDNAFWAPAVRGIGGDPTVAGQTAGDIYFLQNNWKLYIDLTKVKVTGVLFSDDFDSAYYDYNGKIQFPAQVSSLVSGTTAATPQELWAYNNRTLTQEIAANAPSTAEIAAAVWGYISRTLTESGGTTPQEVWEYANRTLTENVTISDSSISNAVWTASERTLTSDAAPSASTVAATTWDYVNRTLTSENTAPTASAVASAVWSAGSRTLTDPALTAQEVWEYATRTLTSEEIAPTASEVAAAVWAAATRTITSDPTLSASTVSAAVWSAVTRTLTTDAAPSTLENAQAVWEYASRTLTANPGPTAASIADAVWDETYADHDIDGTTGHLLNYMKQIQKEIWLNTELDADGNGSQENPYNDLGSAIDRAEEDGISVINLIGGITLNRNFKNFTLKGIGVPEVDLNGQNIKNSQFLQVKLKGNFVDGANIVVRNSVLLDGAYLNGFVENSSLAGDLICQDGAAVFLKDVASAIPGTGRPTISMNPTGTSQLSVRGYNGGLTIFDCNQAADRVTVELAAGSLTFDSTCTNGIMVARGVGKFVDNTNGATVVNESVNQEMLNPLEASVSSVQITTNTINTNVISLDTKVDTVNANVDEVEAKVLELWRLAGLDAANVASITDSSITVGGITITIGNPDNNTTTLTRS